ncbi:MAG: Maf family protein [Peptococcaceae bacterium]|nr:Maf family protein [Peptococcaceae bacterium]
MQPIILASSSPRRAELLRQIGLKYETLVYPVDETPVPGLSPSALVEKLSEKKALAVAEKLRQGLVIGADTVVVRQGEVLGKPADFEEAVKMLKRLQGAPHEVFTGLALVDAANGRAVVRHEKTRVFFRNLQDDEIRRYVDTGEPMDKAGAYGVQGIAAIFIEKIEGCYSNVVGLPLALLAKMLGEFGFSVL